MLPPASPFLHKVGIRVWPLSVDGLDKNRCAVHTESSSTPSSHSCQCSHLVQSMASAYAFCFVQYSSCTGSRGFAVRCALQPSLHILCFMSVSSLIHHRLEYGHGQDTGTTAAIVVVIAVLRSCNAMLKSSGMLRIVGSGMLRRCLDS